MNETLREKEELSRIDAENLRKTKEDLTIFRRKVDQHAELMAEKDRTVQVRTTMLRPSTFTYLLPSLYPDPARRDQHLATRAWPDRGPQFHPYQG